MTLVAAIVMSCNKSSSLTLYTPHSTHPSQVLVTHTVHSPLNASLLSPPNSHCTLLTQRIPLKSSSLTLYTPHSTHPSQVLVTHTVHSPLNASLSSHRQSHYTPHSTHPSQVLITHTVHSPLSVSLSSPRHSHYILLTQRIPLQLAFYVPVCSALSLHCSTLSAHSTLWFN